MGGSAIQVSLIAFALHHILRLVVESISSYVTKNTNKIARSGTYKALGTEVSDLGRIDKT